MFMNLDVLNRSLFLSMCSYLRNELILKPMLFHVHIICLHHFFKFQVNDINLTISEIYFHSKPLLKMFVVAWLKYDHLYKDRIRRMKNRPYQQHLYQQILSYNYMKSRSLYEQQYSKEHIASHCKHCGLPLWLLQHVFPIKLYEKSNRPQCDISRKIVNESGHVKLSLPVCGNSCDSNQHAQLCMLISAFSFHCNISSRIIDS